MATQHDAEWIVAAHNIFRNTYGVHSGLAIAAAESLLNREKATKAKNPEYAIRSPDAAVTAHMDSEEEPLVDPDGEYPEPEGTF